MGCRMHGAPQHPMNDGLSMYPSAEAGSAGKPTSKNQLSFDSNAFRTSHQARPQGVPHPSDVRSSANSSHAATASACRFRATNRHDPLFDHLVSLDEAAGSGKAERNALVS
jgi:hypothetical protein